MLTMLVSSFYTKIGLMKESTSGSVLNCEEKFLDPIEICCHARIWKKAGWMVVALTHTAANSRF